jgi:hypothetical protein
VRLPALPKMATAGDSVKASAALVEAVANFPARLNVL